MEPIGTITKYYRFVDTEISQILDSITRDATNLQDFVQRLIDNVTLEDVSPQLAQIAAIVVQFIEGLSGPFQLRLFWSNPLHGNNVRSRLAMKYCDTHLVRPWITPFWSGTEGLDAYHHFLEVVDETIDSEKDDWIRMCLYLRKAGARVTTQEGIASIDAAYTLLDQNPELDCFAARLYLLDGAIKSYEGDIEGAIQACKKGLESARKYNDVYEEAILLISLGYHFVNSNPHKAMELAEKANMLSQSTGLITLIRSTLILMGEISHCLGEYDLALESYFQAMKLEPIESYYHVLIDISDVYSDLVNGEKALEWANEYSRGNPAGLDEHICPHLSLAKALILLGRLREAEEHIQKSYEIALKSGVEIFLARHYFVSGCYEIAMGDLHTGQQTIKRSLEISKRLKSQIRVNRCLRVLAKAEIDAIPEESTSMDPGPWILRLEKEAQEKNLPGILLQHALLKSESYAKSGKIEKAIQVLVEMLEEYDLPSLRTLHREIVDRIEEMEH